MTRAGVRLAKDNVARSVRDAPCRAVASTGRPRICCFVALMVLINTGAKRNGLAAVGALGKGLVGAVELRVKVRWLASWFRVLALSTEADW